MFKILALETLIDATRKFDNIDMCNIITIGINKKRRLPKELERLDDSKTMLRFNSDVSKGLV